MTTVYAQAADSVPVNDTFIGYAMIAGAVLLAAAVIFIVLREIRRRRRENKE